MTEGKPYTPGGKGFRPEIQGLRAIAIIAVFAFHLAPGGVVSGGYVGVDVFFVISGFLITGILFNEFRTTGAISITRFYSRRIRRLLPAATLVLVAVTAVMAVFPAARWFGIGDDITASALYFQNWHLAAKAVNYLTSAGPQSPVEHFWSLSVEEQYYFVWPLLALLSVRIVRAARHHPKAAFGVFIAIIGVSSLAWSIYRTPRMPSMAYFATTTRAFELALGGGLAVFRGWENWPSKLRAALGPVGIALIVLSCVLFTTSTAFPGYHALLPTVGAALVIICGGCGGRLSTQRLLAIKPVQYIGDISYSLYLWHWPVIAVYAQLKGGPLGTTDTLIIIAVSLSLAHQSKVYVEDRFRAGRKTRKVRRDWKPFGLGVLCLGCAVLAPVAMLAHLPTSPPLANAIGISSTQYPGARVLTGAAAVPADAGPYLPRPRVAAKDKPSTRSRCIQVLAGTAVMTCEFGMHDASALDVVLLGDSHADQWLPAMRLIAQKRHWHLTTLTKSACAFAFVTVSEFTSKLNKTCAIWNSQAIFWLLQHRPDVVILSESIGSLSHIKPKGDATSRQRLVSAMVASWRTLIAADIRLIVIKDTPHPGVNVPNCLSSHGNTIIDCSRPRHEALDHVDPLLLAASRVPEVRVINMDDAVCGPVWCRAVTGNVTVYRDSSHLSATYVRTATSALANKIGMLRKKPTGHDDNAPGG